MPLLRGRTRRDVPVSLAESWYPRLHFGWSELRSARVGEWKYIAAPKPELYDLRTIAARRKNVCPAIARAVAARLAAERPGRLSRFTQRRADARAPAQPDPATVERLQALGYVGAFAPVTAGAAAENPADRIADYRRTAICSTARSALLGAGSARPRPRRSCSGS